MGSSSGGVTGPSVAFFVASHPSLWSAIAHNRSQCLLQGTRTEESHGVATGSPGGNHAGFGDLSSALAGGAIVSSGLRLGVMYSSTRREARS